MDHDHNDWKALKDWFNANKGVKQPMEQPRLPLEHFLDSSYNVEAKAPKTVVDQIDEIIEALKNLKERLTNES